VLVIKICGALVFVAAVLIGVGVEFSRIVFSYVAMGLAGAALVAVLVSALPLFKRKASRYP
jgi:hypothetical protein